MHGLTQIVVVVVGMLAFTTQTRAADASDGVTSMERLNSTFRRLLSLVLPSNSAVRLAFRRKTALPHGILS